jgi:hypothetical protein
VLVVIRLDIAIEIRAAAETLDHVRNYVARTLKKA